MTRTHGKFVIDLRELVDCVQEGNKGHAQESRAVVLSPLPDPSQDKHEGETQI